MPILRSGSQLITHRNSASNGLLANLVAYWGLDEAAGANNALDKHTNALTLTQTGSPGSTTGKVYAGARTFDGSTQYFSRASEAALQFGDNDWSIAAWVYLTDSTVDHPIVGKYDTTGNQRGVSINYYQTEGKLRVFLSSTGGTPTTVLGGAIGLNAWTFATVTYNATTDVCSTQINNATAITGSHASGIYANTAPFEIGRAYLGAERQWKGRQGPIAMWRSAAGLGGCLSAAQLTWLYNSGNGRAYAELSSYA